MTAIKQSILSEIDTFDVVFGSHSPVEEKAISDFVRDEKAHESVKLVVKVTSTTLFTLRCIMDVVKASLSPLFRSEKGTNGGDSVGDFGASKRRRPGIRGSLLGLRLKESKQLGAEFVLECLVSFSTRHDSK